MKLDSATIEAAKNYIRFKTAALRQANGHFKVIQALRLKRRLARSFGRQKDWIAENIQSLSFFNNKQKVKFIQIKAVKDEINNLLDDMPENENIAEAIGQSGKEVYEKGAEAAHLQLNMAKVGIDLGLINPRAIDYLKKKKTLNLSDYKGSIKRTTKKQIIKILTDAAESGQSYQDTAKQIMEQGDAGVFSQARGQLIATNEIGHAYGEGNHEMVSIYHQETGAIVQKCWLTVNDDLVTEECMANQDEGWIEFEEQFDSGDDIAPRDSNPNCRCDCGYRHVDSQGDEL